MYCPRRFSLLELNDDWAENAFVVKANIMHDAVHKAEHGYSSAAKVVKSAVAVYNDKPEYNIFGVTDVIEFVKAKHGVPVLGLSGLFKVSIVEYKPKPPKDGQFHESDAMHIFAQKLCVDFVFGCDSEAYVYYAERRRRVRLPFDDQAFYNKYDTLIKEYLVSMRELLSINKIAQKRVGQNCSGCSLSAVCFAKSSSYDVRCVLTQMD